MMIAMDEAGMMMVDPMVVRTTMRTTPIQMEDSGQLLVNRIIQDHLMTGVSNRTGRTLPEDHQQTGMSLLQEIDPHLMFNALPMFRNEVGRGSKDKMCRENGQAVQTITMARVSWQQSQHKKREVVKGIRLFNRTDEDQQEVQTFNDLTIKEARTNQVVIKEEDNSLPLYNLTHCVVPGTAALSQM